MEAEGGSSDGTVELWQTQDSVGDAGSDLTSVSASGKGMEDQPTSLEAMHVLHDEFWFKIKSAIVLKA